ncbi:hypothetical protein BAUCODRAFT_273936 [Baudoinia panamericana UAMH 10762]|uniref:Uncharacterized protein n=1 Tax=Baudoinia panamericana (strain UAMH 10762) TaxID=717646 RepID=M2M9L2_BAUPA|nr:uncharacterized protein BAUCODRAFT_273936 [Baudoinia panamericana UAMH 10762]EMC93106.1 hypothetical protein BAUCODRAFT_273936 [Baudoinia panamericana UAMH 10762]
MKIGSSRRYDLCHTSYNIGSAPERRARGPVTAPPFCLPEEKSSAFMVPSQSS